MWTGGLAVRALRGAVPSRCGPAPFAPSASSLAFSVENEGTGTQGVWHCVPGPALVGGGDLASPSACFPGPCLAVLGERPHGLLQAWSLSPRLRPAPEDPSDTWFGLGLRVPVVEVSVGFGLPSLWQLFLHSENCMGSLISPPRVTGTGLFGAWLRFAYL